MTKQESTSKLPAMEFDIEWAQAAPDLPWKIRNVVGPSGWFDAEWSRKFLRDHSEMPEFVKAFEKQATRAAKVAVERAAKASKARAEQSVE
jgi:hypothetical protein